MNLESVKDIIYDVVSKFYADATVIWAEQIITKPPLPYVTLKVGNVGKTAFPITDKEGNRYYPCNTVLEMNLYTKGKPVTVEKNVTGNYANTAVSDMLDFFKFIESDIMIDYLAVKGIDVLLVPPVRDLTALQNDSKYRYRSMAEATVTWSENADGPYGISGMPVAPNDSGGGTEEMRTAVADVFEKAELTDITTGGKEKDEE